MTTEEHAVPKLCWRLVIIPTTELDLGTSGGPMGIGTNREGTRVARRGGERR